MLIVTWVTIAFSSLIDSDEVNDETDNDVFEDQQVLSVGPAECNSKKEEITRYCIFAHSERKQQLKRAHE